MTIADRTGTWLHRHGIARVLNSVSSTYRPDVDVLMEARWWTPRWLAVWAANNYFRWMYASRAAQLCLARVRRHETAADGTRRWRLHYQPTDRRQR